MSLTIFQFEQQSIRTIDINGQPAFCLADLLNAYKSTTRPSDAKVAIEEVLGDGVVKSAPYSDSLGRLQETLFVFESGVTFLITRSRTETGKKLARWVHQEVLPSIRKTGSYSTGQPSEHKHTTLSESDKLALMAEGFLKERAERVALAAQIEADSDATTLGKAIAKAPNNIRIGDFAKSIDMGQNRYFDELRTDGIIQQTSTLPYQRFLDAKYFVVTQIISGNGKTYPVALITPKGQTYLAKRHRKFISQEAMRDAIECQVVALV
jgi:prophage antirepressor-like protein